MKSAMKRGAGHAMRRAVADAAREIPLGSEVADVAGVDPPEPEDEWDGDDCQCIDCQNERGVGIGYVTIAGERYPAPAGVECRQIQPFNERPRRTAYVTEFIFHESVTKSDEAAIAVLRRRGLGVDLVTNTAEGPPVVHVGGDLLIDRPGHIGSPHNDHSVSLECAGPYYPRHMEPPFDNVIEAPWAHQDRYVVPLLSELEAGARMVAWLTRPEIPLDIPRVWPAYDRENHRWRMAPVRGLDQPTPGVYAHHHVGGHADGAFPCLFAWLRVECGLLEEDAYEAACYLATGAGRWLRLPPNIRPVREG